MAGVEGYGPATYGDRFADVYDDWYERVSPPEATAAFVGRRVRGLVVELGSGTGRLASPLRAGGTSVVGLDASEAMLRRSLRRDPALPVVAADMADPPFRAGSAAGVLVAFNTLFNLPSAHRQQATLRRAAELVAPGGVVIIEAFVPDERGRGLDDRVDLVRIDADVVVLRVSRTDHEAGTISGQHVELRDGAPVRLRPWHLRFCDPAQLDELAAGAGLRLLERHADWDERPFDHHSPTHVSVYGPLEEPRIVSGR